MKLLVQPIKKLLPLMLLFNCLACQDKLELLRIYADLPLFQSYWYEAEKTLFVFYRMKMTERVKPSALVEYQVEQGIWTDVGRAPVIQKHHHVDCGPDQKCGSFSLKADKEPTQVGLRLRYSADGELADEFRSAPRVISQIAGTLDRSFYVYGIFDLTNRFVQWRGRNNFPGITHDEAMFFGLERPYSVDGHHGLSESSEISTVLPSHYGIIDPCSGTLLDPNKKFSDIGEDIWLQTAVPEAFPETCVTAHNFDASGPVDLSAVARKNPIVSPIEQDLTLRFTEAQLIPLIFATCESQDDDYLAFQKGRLAMPDTATTVCIESSDFNAESIRQLLLAKIKEARAAVTKSVALTIILHYTKEAQAQEIESIIAKSLALVLDDSLNPYVAATFVYDSFGKTAVPVAPKPAVIWCPTLNTLTQTLNSCYFSPAKLVLGPLEVRVSPLLPDYPSFLELDERQKSGIKVQKLRVLTPAEPSNEGKLEITAAEGEGYWIFHPDDKLNMKGSEYYSYCQKADPTLSLAFHMVSSEEGSKDAEPSFLQNLSIDHNKRLKDEVAQIGLFTPYPFYLAIDYRNTLAIGPKGLTGLLTIDQRKVPVNEELGSRILAEERIPMRKVLSRCTQYCKNPSFDDTGTYLLGRPWYQEFQTKCYEPKIPSFEGAN